MSDTPKVTLYTRKGCCLCDDAKHVLELARRRAHFDLDEIDIDRDPDLETLYNEEVPVIAINGSNIAASMPTFEPSSLLRYPVPFGRYLLLRSLLGLLTPSTVVGCLALLAAAVGITVADLRLGPIA